MRDRIQGNFVLAICWSATVTFTGGCGDNPNGPGSYHAAVQATKNSQESLEAIGAKMQRKQYPLGSAWAVDLSGADITDDTFVSLEKLDRIAELNLSGSTITDEQMEHFKGGEFGGLITNLDLSNTAVTDATLDEMKDFLFLTELNVTGSKITSPAIDQWQKERIADSRVRATFKQVKIRR